MKLRYCVKIAKCTYLYFDTLEEAVKYWKNENTSYRAIIYIEQMHKGGCYNAGELHLRVR